MDTAFNAAYDQMMHVLAARGMEWARHRFEDLPDPLSADHPSVAALSQAARFAPVCSGLRGKVSPLEIFVRLRLDDRLVDEACAFAEGSNPDRATVDLLAAAQGMGIGDSVRVHRAVKTIRRRDDLDLAQRLALQTLPEPHLLAEAEEWLRTPMQSRCITPDRADLFGRVLMQLYGFGARRPKFASPRTYGEIFDNCLLIADWATAGKHLKALAQIVYCIRLIDPDHDVRPWLAEVIASQRPDGSFPARTGFGTADQDLEGAGQATIMAIAALHIALYGRWRNPPQDRLAA